MRTWECLELGGIPIIEDWSEYHITDGSIEAATQSGGGSGKSGNWTRDAMESYLGRYGMESLPFPVVHHSWSNAADVLSPLLNDTRRLQELWVEVQAWYTAQKKRTRRAVRRFISDRMWQSRAFRAAQDIGFCTVFHPTDGARGIYVNLPCFV